MRLRRRDKDRPTNGYPTVEPLTPHAWTVVAVVGAVIAVVGLALNVEVTTGGIELGITPLMLLGVILVVLSIPMRKRAVGREQRAEMQPPPPPPPVDPAP
jgi:hypothetical protein